MNLRRFFASYFVTSDSGNAPVPEIIRNRVDADFLSVLNQLGGKSFNHGLFRVYRGDQLESRTEQLYRQFVAVAGQAIVFAADWLGRQFIIDFSEMKRGKPTVVCLEPGVPGSFCIDQPIGRFHNVDLVEHPDAVVAQALFNKWRERQNLDVPFDQCAGYKIPLFLGGKDELDNLELVDMDVYLELCCQLWNKVKDLPEGTRIGE